ncbi:hypothetical protein ABZT15_39600, partial [Streptomyces sp. NPDC005507]
ANPRPKPHLNLDAAPAPPKQSPRNQAGGSGLNGWIAVSSLSDAVPAHLRRSPLGWADVRAWETAHGIELPEPYRTFVAEVSNGSLEGPSAACGLLPLGELPENWKGWEADCWLSPEPFDGTAARNLTEPFPLEEEWQWEYDYYDDDEHSPLSASAERGPTLVG